MKLKLKLERAVSDDNIHKLRFFFPDDLLLAALDLVDREKGERLILAIRDEGFNTCILIPHYRLSLFRRDREQ